MSANPEDATERHENAPAPLPRTEGLLLVAYTFAVFSSAFLLFLVQPMFGRMVLPLLGGSPAVWNTCMLFFQTALLVGYLYAHLGSRWLEVRRQWILHLTLLGLASLALPISVRGMEPRSGDDPVAWLLLLMVTAVGPPFVVLAATGPMLQRWFARSGHPDAKQPYHLYAASNLGSMLALLAYPALVEPRLRLAEQALAWTIGFVGLALSIAACGALGWAGTLPVATRTVAVADTVPVPAGERAWWVFLAFVPSTLLLGVTTYITTDLTPAPLLWVVPLALYLLSFTLTFARRPPIPHPWAVAVQPAALAAVVIALQRMEHLDEPALTLPLHLLGLFLTAMVCHGELARRRPPVRHLTEFYLWIAVGGALGGLFNVLVAPLLFSELWEYPAALVLACLARPWPARVEPFRTNLWLALRAAAFALVLVLIGKEAEELSKLVLVPMVVGVVGLLALALGRVPLWLYVCFAAVVVSGYVEGSRDRSSLLVERSFFGQYRVNRSEYGYHVLQHGSTLHGAQSLAPRQRRDPLTYYVREGPLGDVFTSMGISTTPWRVAVVGLGTGTAAAYASTGDEWTFYELDPGIERIARDPRFFTYLADSPGRIRVVLGDARLSLARDSAPVYDLILLDAFSSDAIPIHLLTREALGIYLSRLAPDGRIAIHISNRYLDLEPVVAALARERGMTALVGTGPPKKMGFYENSSTWVVVARSREDLLALARLGDWKAARLDPAVRPWRDDFSSLLGVLRW